TGSPWHSRRSTEATDPRAPPRAQPGREPGSVPLADPRPHQRSCSERTGRAPLSHPHPPPTADRGVWVRERKREERWCGEREGERGRRRRERSEGEEGEGEGGTSRPPPGRRPSPHRPGRACPALARRAESCQPPS